MLKAKPIQDLSGRELGERALKKRRQLMDATLKLLRKKKLRDIRVADIARAVDTSPATFYQYFKDVEDVVLSLAEDATQQMPSIGALFEGDWEAEAGLQRSREVVDAFISYWDEYGAVLRVRNLAADEGDKRFLKVRGDGTKPIIDAMVKRMGKGKNRKAYKPIAAAVAMGAILERLSAYHRELEGMGISREELVETSAQILFRTLTSGPIEF